MFSFNSYRRLFMRSAFILLILSALFLGCKTDSDDIVPVIELDQRLVGIFDNTVGKDVYEITSDLKLYYYGTDFFTGDDFVWGGKIVYAAKFSDTSGIIIIEYDTDKKQVWMDWYADPIPEPLDPQPAGYFYGIYYDSLTANSFIPSNTSDQLDFGPCETETLEEAKNRFTLDAKTDWMNPAFATIVYTRVAE